MLEGLEVDQYIWGIVQSLQSNGAPAPPGCDEVTIDAAANWKPVTASVLGVASDQHDIGVLGAFCPRDAVLARLLAMACVCLSLCVRPCLSQVGVPS